MSTRRCRAEQALRMRVNMSATGSVMLIPQYSLPAGFTHARDFAAQREVPETNAAQAELAQVRALAAAALAARDHPRAELRLPLGLLDPALLRHGPLPVRPRGRAVRR